MSYGQREAFHNSPAQQQPPYYPPATQQGYPGLPPMPAYGAPPQGVPPPNFGGYPAPNTPGYAPQPGYLQQPPPPHGYPQQQQPPPPQQPQYYPQPQYQQPFQQPYPQQFPPNGYASPHPPPVQQQPSFPPSGYASPALPGGYQTAPQNLSAPAPQINVTPDITAIHKACKGFGTDEAALINILANRDGPTIDKIRREYSYGDLIALLDKETSGNFRTALHATALGPVESVVYWAHKAIAGVGTNEEMLTEAIMGRTNYEMSQMKQLYQQKYRRTLEADVAGDLSMKTKELFMLAINANKPEEWVQANPTEAVNMATAIYAATKGRLGTDETTVSGILTKCNENMIRAIIYEYTRLHGDFVKMIKAEFSGHMKQAFLYLVEGAQDKAKRDAALLEASMKGLGTKDDLLIMRVVRIHWDRQHMERVKVAYRALYNKELSARVRGETSGDYRKMLLEMIK